MSVHDSPVALGRDDSTVITARHFDASDRSWVEDGLGEFFLYHDEMTVVLEYLDSCAVMQLMFVNHDFYMRFSLNEVWVPMLVRDFATIELSVAIGVPFPLEMIRNSETKHPDRLLRLESVAEMVAPAPGAPLEAGFAFSPPDGQEFAVFEHPRVQLKYRYDESALPLYTRRVLKQRSGGQSLHLRLLREIKEALAPEGSAASATLLQRAPSMSLKKDGSSAAWEMFKAYSLTSRYKADARAAFDYYFNFTAALSFPYTYYLWTHTAGSEMDVSVFTAVRNMQASSANFARFGDRLIPLIDEETSTRRISHPPLPFSFRASTIEVANRERLYAIMVYHFDTMVVHAVTVGAACGLMFAIRWLNGTAACDNFIGVKLVTSQLDKPIAFCAAVESGAAGGGTSVDYDFIADVTNGARLLGKNLLRASLETFPLYPIVWTSTKIFRTRSIRVVMKILPPALREQVRIDARGSVERRLELFARNFGTVLQNWMLRPMLQIAALSSLARICLSPSTADRVAKWVPPLVMGLTTVVSVVDTVFNARSLALDYMEVMKNGRIRDNVSRREVWANVNKWEIALVGLDVTKHVLRCAIWARFGFVPMALSSAAVIWLQEPALAV